MTRDFARSEQHLRHADESASRGSAGDRCFAADRPLVAKGRVILGGRQRWGRSTIRRYTLPTAYLG